MNVKNSSTSFVQGFDLNIKPIVLYVDDEPSNLLVFRTTLRNVAEVYTATSGKEGLELLDKYPIQVVLSDMRMPEMDGSEFLAKVCARSPHSIRMMVSAFSDFEGAVRAVNVAHVDAFLRKPWEPAEMLSTVLNAAKRFQLKKESIELTTEAVHKECLVTLSELAGPLNRELKDVLSIFKPIEEWSFVHSQLKTGSNTENDAEKHVKQAAMAVDELRKMLRMLRLFSKVSSTDSHAVHSHAVQMVDLIEIFKRTEAMVHLLAEDGQGTCELEAPRAVWVNVDGTRLSHVLSMCLSTIAKILDAPLELQVRAQSDEKLASLEAHVYKKVISGAPENKMAANSKDDSFPFWLSEQMIHQMSGHFEVKKLNHPREGFHLKLELPVADARVE